MRLRDFLHGVNYRKYSSEGGVENTHYSRRDTHTAPCMNYEAGLSPSRNYRVCGLRCFPYCEKASPHQQRYVRQEELQALHAWARARGPFLGPDRCENLSIPGDGT